MVLLGGFLLLTKQSFKVTAKQAGVLLLLGVLYTMSSTTLFEAYKYIASGLATTLVFLYPVLVAIIMVFCVWCRRGRCGSRLLPRLSV